MWSCCIVGKSHTEKSFMQDFLDALRPNAIRQCSGAENVLMSPPGHPSSATSSLLEMAARWRHTLGCDAGEDSRAAGRDCLATLYPQASTLCSAALTESDLEPIDRPSGLSPSATRNEAGACLLGLADLVHTAGRKTTVPPSPKSRLPPPQQLGHYNDVVMRVTYLHWLPVKSNENLSRLGLKA